MDASIPLPQMALRIAAAVALAALVGLERERKRRPAGFRTMILISIGCCGFVLIGHELVTEGRAALSAAGIQIDPLSRVLQGLMGGVGFLGAGAVIQSKRAVRGLTTAAATWCVAAIGASCGFGLFKIAFLLSTAALFTLVILEHVENKYFPDEPADDTPPTVVRIDTSEWKRTGLSDEAAEAVAKAAVESSKH